MALAIRRLRYGEGEQGRLIRELRALLERFSPALFKDQDDLVLKVMQSVHLAEASLPVSTIALPSELKDPDPLFLMSSAKEEIDRKYELCRKRNERAFWS
jgi:hypothetical protein